MGEATARVRRKDRGSNELANKKTATCSTTAAAATTTTTTTTHHHHHHHRRHHHKKEKETRKTKKFVRVSTACAHGTAWRCNDRGSSRLTTEKKTSVKFNNNNNNHIIIIIIINNNNNNNNKAQQQQQQQRTTTTSTSKILRKGERKKQEIHIVGCNRWRPGCSREAQRQKRPHAGSRHVCSSSMELHIFSSLLTSRILSGRPSCGSCTYHIVHLFPPFLVSFLIVSFAS